MCGSVEVQNLSGVEKNPIARIQAGARFTSFMSDASPKSARKKWISGSLNPMGVLLIDDGAEFALKAGKSLLPAGIINIEGDFQRGDAVIVKSNHNEEVARGLVAYSAEDAKKIIGYKTDEIEKILGYRRFDEMIHRDDLVLN